MHFHQPHLLTSSGNLTEGQLIHKIVANISRVDTKKSICCTIIGGCVLAFAIRGGLVLFCTLEKQHISIVANHPGIFPYVPVVSWNAWFNNNVPEYRWIAQMGVWFKYKPSILASFSLYNIISIFSARNLSVVTQIMGVATQIGVVQNFLRCYIPCLRLFSHKLGNYALSSMQSGCSHNCNNAITLFTHSHAQVVKWLVCLS